MATTSTTPSVNTTSMFNTPQAVDDTYTFSQTYLEGLASNGIVTLSLDVMANDLGGAAKDLWAVVDQEDTGPVTYSAAETADLISKDATGEWKTTRPGTKVAVVNGKLSYQMDASAMAVIKALPAGQTVTDVISYSIRLANGTLSVAEVTITIAGTNDAAVITGTSAVTITETDSALSAGSKLNVTDVDTGEAKFQVQSNVAGNHGYGTFSIDANGNWTYSAGAHNEFAAGQSYTDSVTVKSIDGTSQVITVTIVGTNDAPVVSGAVTGTATEGGASSTLNALANASDVDLGASLSVTNVPGTLPAGVTYNAATHSFSFDPSNSAYDYLAAGATATVTVTYGVTDGTATVPASVSWTITGTNDAAIITGTSTATITETDAALSASGKLNATDVDSSAAFVAQTDVAGDHGYGTFSIDAAGNWTYAAGAHNEFVGGQTYTDSVTVKTADGTSQVITVTITGTNDAAVITGSTGATLTESDAALNASGKLDASDVDSSAAFVAQTNVAGDHGYGTFSIDADGNWTYAAGAHNEFAAGQAYTDSITVATADGTSQVITVTITGTNDAAVITGSSSADLTESDAALSASGKLDVTDVDSSAAFVAQTNAAGDHGYGTFSIDADGNWTYAADAHNEFVAGQTYTDSVTVATADGTTQVITVTIYGTNDAAVITGTASAEGDETDAALTLGGKLSATDVDSSADFQAGTLAGSHGSFTIAADGTWSYTADSANDALNVGDSVTDSVVVKTIDGTEQTLSVTIHGTNDAAVITGTASAEGDETDAALTLGGKLSATDVDSSADFQAGTLAGSHGSFTIAADGTWSYTADSANDVLNVGDSVTDSVVVKTIDGTEQTLSVTIHGTNDAAVITGTASAEGNETDAAVTLGGKLSATDVDSSADFQAGTLAGSHGSFTIAADGTWSYTADSANDVLNVGDSVTDSVVVKTIDGTEQTLSVTIHGTNDAAVITGTASAEGNETDAAVTLGGKLSATDVDSSADFQAGTLAGSHGSFTIAADGTWSYTADSANDALNVGDSVTDSVVVKTTDGTEQTLSVTIHGTNDAAVITGTASAEGDETDAAVTLGGKLSATDVDSSADFQAGTLAGAHGSFTIAADGTWSYTADSANDALNVGDSVTDSVVVKTIDGTEQTLSVTIRGTNDAPVVAAALTAAANEDGAAFNLDLLGGASDVDNANLHVSDVTGLVAGVTLSGDTLIVDPANAAFQSLQAGETREIVVNYNVIDGQGGSVAQSATITITGTNDGATISGDTTGGTVVEDGVTQLTGHVSVADADHDQAAAIAASATGTYGSFSVDAAGNWSYQLDNASAAVQSLANGQVVSEQSFTSESADHSASVTLNFSVQGTNDAPKVTLTQSATATEDGSPVSLNALAGTSDVDATDTLSVTYTSLPAGVTYDATTHQFTLDPTNAAFQHLAAGATDTVTVNYGVSDGTTTTPSSLSFKVTGVNDAATITVDSAVTNDRAVTEAGVAAGDANASGKLLVTDVDDGQAAFQTPASLAGTYGTYTFNATTGSWTYTLDNTKAATQALTASQTVQDHLTVVSADGTATHDIAVTVTGANDAATITVDATVANDRAVTEAGGLANATAGDASAAGKLLVTDPDSGQAAFQTPASLAGTYGTYTFNATTGSWTYTLDNTKAATQALTASQTVQDHLTVVSADGTASHDIAVTVTGANDTATFGGTSTGSVTEDSTTLTSATGTLTVTDPDLNQASFVAQTNAAGTYGSLSINSAGAWTYTIDNTKSGFATLNTGTTAHDIFTVQSADGTTTTIDVSVVGNTDVTLAAVQTASGDPNDFDSQGAAGDIKFQGNGQSADTVYGGPGNDTINGNSGNDTLYGGSGDDKLDGGADNDTIYGGSGNDTITGGNNVDVLIGGWGADTLTGNQGNDTFKFLSALDRGDTITDFTHANGEQDKIDVSSIDADQNTAGFQHFTFNGTTPTANGLWYVVNGSDVVLYGDIGGNTATIELHVTLTGVTSLTAADFIL
ncbi:VCBS domain-containing protein [Novosphingobium olei]|uniref:VCBS domain-containing protein n=1 Tax=Novosphingobium olei TaxID=2728851 RepID=UPI0030893271|nr:VCBS domain-containing protein [Novosphingobium olei]